MVVRGRGRAHEALHGLVEGDRAVVAGLDDVATVDVAYDLAIGPDLLREGVLAGREVATVAAAREAALIELVAVHALAVRWHGHESDGLLEIDAADVAVDVGGRLYPCAGAIAHLYEEIGGPVYWAGKPYASAYDLAGAEARRIRGQATPADRILVIGDAVRTDLAGAAAQGFDALFISYGIHRDELHEADGALRPDALAALLPRPDDLLAGLERYDEAYASDFCSAYAAKLGLREWRHDDAQLLEDLFALMHRAEIDMTAFFRSLALLDPERPQPQLFDDTFYRADLRQRHGPGLAGWLQRYAARLRLDGRPPELRVAAMNAVNPRFVLRNYLAQQAIDRADQGDGQMIHELLEVLRRPYDEQPGREAFSARRPDWARHRAGCSMLSCSS